MIVLTFVLSHCFIVKLLTKPILLRIAFFCYEFNNLGGEQKFTRTMGSFHNSYLLGVTGFVTLAVRFGLGLGWVFGLLLPDKLYIRTKKSSYERQKI